jgi:hypothetical protein
LTRKRSGESLRKNSPESRLKKAFLFRRCRRRSGGPPELAAVAGEAQALIDKGDFDAARAVLVRGREVARKLREESSRYEAQLLAQESRVDHLELAGSSL